MNKEEETAGKLLNNVFFGQGNQKLGGNSLLSVAMEILGKLLREASSCGDGITQKLLREGFWWWEQEEENDGKLLRERFFFPWRWR